MIKTTRLRPWEWLVLFLLLALFVAQAALSSPLKSAAFDEQYHVAAGYAYLRTGDFRLSRSHPPLVDTLSAIPLLWLPDVNLPLDHPAWANSDYFIFADVFLWQANGNPQQLLVLARLPIIALGALLAAVLFFWARQMAGPAAGWIALILAVFDPNLLANARLVTTDLGLALFVLLAVWRLWHWLERPTRRNLLLTGFFAGLATATKFTGLMVWPILGIVVLVYPQSQKLATENWRLKTGGWRLGRLSSPVSNLFLMGLIGYLTLWAVFRFDVGRIPQTDFPIPIPAPFYPYSVLDTWRVIEEQPKTAFLLGQTSPRGWWYYFPVALAVKTPLPLLLLTAVGAVMLLRRVGWRRSAALWLPPLLFLALGMSGRLTIGYRHILPAVPFLIMLAAQVGRLGTGDWRLKRSLQLPASSLLLLCLLWQIVSVTWLFPHHEAFFNELAGGPIGGSRVLVDSNLDWGQDLITLRQLLAEQGIDQVSLAYFGTALPEAYEISYQPIPGFLRFTTGTEVDAYNPYTPLPGWYAISLTSLRLGLLEQNVNLYAYFRDTEPVARAGYSINLYHVDYPDGMPVDRTVITGRSVADIPPQELGVKPGHRLITKWTRSLETTITPWTAVTGLPPDAVPVSAVFADAFTLWGYALAQPNGRPGDEVTLTLYWRRESAAIPMPAPATASPLAAFVHLSGEDPADIVAQYDGWDVALAGLEPGDLISQRVTIPIPAGTLPGVYYLRAGLYSPQSGQRLPLRFSTPGEATADMVTLTAVTIR